MSKRIRIGIIGVGIIGKQHIQGYAHIPGVEIVAIADIDEFEAKRVGTAHSIKHVFTDYHDVLNMAEIDAVDVCLHNNLHAPVTIAALEAGKHVYCEKPMAGSYFDAKAMLDASTRSGKMLSIQLATLFSKEHKAAKHLVEEGHLGRIYAARAFGFRRRGRPFVDGYATPEFVMKSVAAGGALFDMGVYHIAEVLDLLGNPKPVTITGATYQEIEMYEEPANSAGYGVEEIGIGHVRLEGGITFSIEETWAVHYDGSESCKILGSKAGLKLHPLTFYSKVGDLEYSGPVDVDGPDYRWHRWVKDYDAYDGNQEHWVAALRGRVPLLPTAELALNVMLISEGIYWSQERGCEVKAADVIAGSKSSALDV